MYRGGRALIEFELYKWRLYHVRFSARLGGKYGAAASLPRITDLSNHIEYT